MDYCFKVYFHLFNGSEDLFSYNYNLRGGFYNLQGGSEDLFSHNYDLGGGFYDLGSDNYHLKGLPKGIFTGFYPVFSYFLQKTGVIHCICPQILRSWSSL